MAKFAADRGVTLPRPYFPVTALAEDKLVVPTALALAIARRESEFNPTVVSSAGARGLMQVMPATAAKMAAHIGVNYEEAKLLTDPDYNLSLGAAYLDVLIKEFGPNYILVTAGYNAGPGRPRRWVTEFGDPRSGADPIDWIEHVPFDETRNYIMRVIESYVVYQARLEGLSGPVNMTTLLTAS
jgi:soluble lytic murein transglycosylase